MLAIVGVELFQGELHYRCAALGFVETAGHPGLHYDPTQGLGSVMRRLWEVGAPRILRGSDGAATGGEGQAAIQPTRLAVYCI